MFLKSLDLYGFKSFADKTHIEFSPGITTLLGPNGCGKSNIVDAIKWVLGEQGTKTLRASKMEDVIFNGNDRRKPMPFAEVALTIDNSSGMLNHPAEEIEIKRRIFRAENAETEYYLNKERCKLKDIKDLLIDTGVGKSAYSVLEQGRIDQIISMRPEERRYIFEEAAGISKFKQQCTEAANKIQRTEENIANVEITVSQVRRTYNRTKDQAEKAAKYKELRAKAVELEVRQNILKIRTFENVQIERHKRIDDMQSQIEKITESLSTYDDDLKELTETYRNKSDYLNSMRASTNTYTERINSIAQILSLLSQRMDEARSNIRNAEDRMASYKNSLDQITETLDEAESKNADETDRKEEIESQLVYLREQLKQTDNNISLAEEEIRKRQEENNKIDDELLKLSEDLKLVIESLIEEFDENTSTNYSKERYERADENVRKKLFDLKALVQSKIDTLSLIKADEVEKSRVASDYSNFYQSLDEIISSFEDFKNAIPPVIDIILSPEGLISRKREIEERERIIREKSESNKRIIQIKRDSLEKLISDREEIKNTLSDLSIARVRCETNIESNLKLIQQLRLRLEEVRYNIEDLENQKETTERNLSRYESEIKDREDERSEASRALSNVNSLIETLSAEVRQMGENLSSKRNEKQSMDIKLTGLRSSIESENMMIAENQRLIASIFEDYYNKTGHSLNEYQSLFEEEMEQVLVENEYKSVMMEIERAGNINYLAEEEFNDAKNNLEFYTKQLSDLEKAKSDLVRVLDEIETKSREMFLRTYNEINRNFQEMFTRLFGGGKAEVSLQDPEEVLTSGIDIFAQPPGKKLTNMSLLSGGERSMTAVALLFATYKVKPSPFCILDEIDAALDDKNIGYFISVLEDFGKTSQFIIITHNKHTVTAGESLLGVTQNEAGVSITASYRLKSIKGEPVILDENEKEVEIKD